MSGLDKILEHINTDATNTANRLLDAAKADAAKLVEETKKEAEAKAAQMAEQSKVAVETAKKRIESAADQKEKRMILEAKQTEIDSVISASMEKLTNLDSKDYFATIVKMVAKYAHAGKAGTISFGKADLERLPADLASQIKSAAKDADLKVAETPANIKNGFVLSYGDVEENCSFDALIEAAKETLQDKIGQMLFG